MFNIIRWLCLEHGSWCVAYRLMRLFHIWHKLVNASIVVVRLLILLTYNICIMASQINTSPLICLQQDGQGYCATWLFSNSTLICGDDLLLIWTILAMLLSISLHVNAWKCNTCWPILICHCPIKLTASSNHGATNASRDGNAHILNLVTVSSDNDHIIV